MRSSTRGSQVMFRNPLISKVRQTSPCLVPVSRHAPGNKQTCPFPRLGGGYCPLRHQTEHTTRSHLSPPLCGAPSKLIDIARCLYTLLAELSLPLSAQVVLCCRFYLVSVTVSDLHRGRSSDTFFAASPLEIPEPWNTPPHIHPVMDGWGFSIYLPQRMTPFLTQSILCGVHVNRLCVVTQARDCRRKWTKMILSKINSSLVPQQQ